MAKKSYKRAVPTSLDDDQIAYIERAGVGKNFSEKLRYILDHARGTSDKIAGDGKAVLVYQRTSDGEKIWGDIPFPFTKSQGWAKLEKAARDANYLFQSVECEEEGTLEIWIKKASAGKNCKECKRQIMEVLHG